MHPRRARHPNTTPGMTVGTSVCRVEEEEEEGGRNRVSEEGGS
jgi:hypothetical protein